MKISMAWVFDHIDTSAFGSWQAIDIVDLVNRFNQTTAEIEHVQKISLDLDVLRLAQVETMNDLSCVVQDEIGVSHTLSLRNGLEIGQWYLIKCMNGVSWASIQDLGGFKEGLMPALMIKGSDIKTWKNYFEYEDYIVDVDNKSITHRPDMWGHRGFAREIAAILQLPLKPLGNFLARAEIDYYDHQSPEHDEQHPWMFAIQKDSGCSRFAAHHIAAVDTKPSLLWMAHRLARVDARAINAIVDTTNYVMFDIGQPMHAFDADNLAHKKLIVRHAQAGEHLHMLDGQKIDLNTADIVVTDGERPVALAGIMGGLDAGVSMITKSIVLESACFDATTIRHSAERHKIRTEASARFEKSLDPNQNVYAIRRFLSLLDGIVFSSQAVSPIISLGALASPKTIEIPHSFIEQKLGIPIESTFIIDILNRLAFDVQEINGSYHISIPTFRGTKDIGIKEDIVEEIGRYVGYAHIFSQLPTMQVKPTDLTPIMRLRTIKNFLAYGCLMRELYNYALYDESFLRTINWQPYETLLVTDPVSENWRRLVTSLIPHLFKAIAHNAIEHDQLRFFEFGRVWNRSQVTSEEKKLAGIMFDKKNIINFYDAKTSIDRLCTMIGLSISWVKVDTPQEPWFMPYQTAFLKHNEKIVGIAGKVNPSFLSQITQGDAFVFELDGDFLLHAKLMSERYQPISKYPEVIRDVSIFLPLTMQVDTVLHFLRNVDNRITSITLIDFFEKNEWHDKKALAFRFVLSDHHKTMTKEEIDDIWSTIVNVLEAQGAVIR